jgi:hypothetical protein
VSDLAGPAENGFEGTYELFCHALVGGNARMPVTTQLLVLGLAAVGGHARIAGSFALLRCRFDACLGSVQVWSTEHGTNRAWDEGFWVVLPDQFEQGDGDVPPLLRRPNKTNAQIPANPTTTGAVKARLRFTTTSF